MKVFISGSISIKKLPKYAIEKLDSIIEKNFTVLIGDAKGIDSLTQKYLAKNNYKNVIVYFAGNKIRNNYGKWETKQVLGQKNEKGRELYTLKDIEMANDTDFGLMIWDGKSKGTLNNVLVMKEKNKRFFLIVEEVVVTEKNVDKILKIQEECSTPDVLQLSMF